MGQLHALAALYPRERPGTHCTGRWVGRRAGLDRCGKSRSSPGFHPRTVQPIASRYTEYATRPTGCLYLPGNSWYLFLLETESNLGPQCGRKDYVNGKPPMIPSGIEPATFWLVAKQRKHVAYVIKYDKVVVSDGIL